VEVRRTTALKDGETVVGNRTKIKIVKNKIAAPFREVEVDILYGRGISREGDALDLGSQHNIVEKSGSWYSFKGERIGQGRENARQTLIDKPELRAMIETELRRVLCLNGNTQKQPPEFELVTTGAESKRASAAS
jgi:recombination protein RecA